MQRPSLRGLLALALLLFIWCETSHADPLLPYTFWGGAPPSNHPPVYPKAIAFRFKTPNRLVYQRLDHIRVQNFRGDLETAVYELGKTGQLLFSFKVTNRSGPGVVLEQLGFDLPKLGTAAMDIGYIGNAPGDVAPVWATRSGNGQRFVFSYDPAVKAVTPGRSTRITYFTVTSPRPVPGGKINIRAAEPGLFYGTEVNFPQPQ